MKMPKAKVWITKLGYIGVHTNWVCGIINDPTVFGIHFGFISWVKTKNV